MDQHGDEERKDGKQQGPALFTRVIIFFCDAVKCAHEDAEAGVSGDSGHRPGDRRGQPVIQDVADVFPQRESQRNKDRGGDVCGLFEHSFRAFLYLFIDYLKYDRIMPKKQ